MSSLREGAASLLMPVAAPHGDPSLVVREEERRQMHLLSYEEHKNSKGKRQKAKVHVASFALQKYAKKIHKKEKKTTTTKTKENNALDIKNFT